MRYDKVVSLAISLTLICSAVTSAHCDAYKYDSSGRRDPFLPLVGADKPVNAGLENIASIEDIRLEGIALSPKGKSRAILNGEMVKENEKIGNLEIKKITRKEVTIIFGGTERTLSLSEEGGNTGGK